MKHVGLHAHRLDPRADNPREIAFAGQWAKENEHDRPGTQSSVGNILRTLVPDAGQRDATVAATLMQWLGSNVGMCFLCDVIGDSPEMARWMRVHMPNAPHQARAVASRHECGCSATHTEERR